MLQIPLMIADVTSPVEPSITGAFSEIAKYGLLGALFILSLIALWFKDKALNASWQQRLTDAQKLTDIISSHTIAMNSLIMSQATLAKAEETQSESQQKIAAMLEVVMKQKG